MIAAQQKEIFWIFDFVGEKEADSLEGLFSCNDKAMNQDQCRS